MKLRETWFERRVFRARIAPVPASKVPWRLHFVRWYLMFVCLQCGLRCVSVLVPRILIWLYVFAKFVHPCCRVCVDVFEP